MRLTFFWFLKFYSFTSFSFKTKLETTIPIPSIETISPKANPTKGIKPTSHKTTAVTINMPKVPIVFSIFNLLQRILLNVIINIALLIIINPNKTNNKTNPKVTVMSKTKNRIASVNSIIGVKAPNPITGKIFFVVKSEVLFFKNFGASHKHNNQITTTVIT